MKPAFFLRHFNDIDHIAPVIWHCLEASDECLVVLLDRTYPADEDERLAVLREYDNCTMTWIDEFLGLEWGQSMFELVPEDGRAPQWAPARYGRRLLRKTGLSDRLAVPALRENDVSACVFEWGPPHRPSHAEIFDAATTLGLPRICIPHGLNIYTNKDIKPGRAQALEEGRKMMSSRNRYDAYVSQSEHNKKQDLTLGVDPEVYRVLGSARYYPEWQSINEDLYERFVPAGADDDRVNVVVMLPHWEYNVDRPTTLELIGRMLDQDWVYLTVKEHTRGDSLPPDLDDRLARAPNGETIADVPSVSLIKWADAVVNFGSSIGIEAFLQETHHVNPSYLHDNTTIFDETGAGHQPDSNEQTVDVTRAIHDGDAATADDERTSALYRAVIYGGREHYDVLDAYRDLIADLAGEAKAQSRK